MDEIMGTVKIFAFNFAPKQWATCDGQLISIAQNQALFALLGTTYGGNGVTTFGLPDLRGRSMISAGTGTFPVVQGEKGGTESVTLTTNTIPAHTHSIVNGAATVTTVIHTIAGATLSNETDNGNNYFATSGDTPTFYSEPVSTQGIGIAGISTSINGASSGTGNGFPFELRNPYVAMYHCILLYGIFPSRN